jgi:hypothetical protein
MFSDLHFETEGFLCFLFLLGLIYPPMSEDCWFLVSTFSRSNSEQVSIQDYPVSFW